MKAEMRLEKIVGYAVVSLLFVCVNWLFFTKGSALGREFFPDLLTLNLIVVAAILFAFGGGQGIEQTLKDSRSANTRNS